jgi:hypothetical protein
MIVWGRAGGAISPKQPWAAWLGVCLLIVVIVVWITKIDPGSAPSPAQAASSYIEDHGTAASTVQAWAEAAASAMALTVNSPTISNIRQLVRTVRQAYRAIDNARRDLPEGERSRALGAAEIEVVDAAVALRGTMAALVAYIVGGFKSPLVDLTSRYEHGRQEWNDGVERIWSIADQQSIPSIP